MPEPQDGWSINSNATSTFQTNNFGSITVNSKNLRDSIGVDTSGISKTHGNYHEYGIINSLGISTKDVDIGIVQAALAAFATPFGPVFAGPGFVTHSSRAPGIVTNYTTDLHVLEPGVVQRSVVIKDGTYHIKTVGIGTGLLPEVNKALSPSVWGIADKRVKDWVLDAIKGGVKMVPSYDKCFLEGTQIDMWDGSQKPIENIASDDVVTSYDKDGKLVPGKVKRTFQNRAKYILDVHGLMVTPGHATYCARVEGEENPFADSHVPIMDILRSDGALAKKDGSLIRAGTGAPVGSIEDRFIWVVTGNRDEDGYVKVREKGKIRLGTRHILPNGEIRCLLNIIGQSGLLITADGLLVDGPTAQTGQPFHWTLTPEIPKPEDYVLQRSAVTLEEIYSAGEWESTKPQMPTPYRGEAGASFHNKPQVLQAGVDTQPPNIPLSMRGHPNQPTMNRQQRRAFKRKQAKQAKKSSFAH